MQTLPTVWEDEQGIGAACVWQEGWQISRRSGCMSQSVLASICPENSGQVKIFQVILGQSGRLLGREDLPCNPMHAMLRAGIPGM